MAIGNYLEEQLRSFLCEGHIAQFIKNQEAEAGKFLSDATDFASRLDNLVDHSGTGGKVRSDPLAAGLNPRTVARWVLPLCKASHKGKHHSRYPLANKTTGNRNATYH